MIAVQVSGGLGNQIILYSLARGIAAKRNDEVVFDLSWYLRRNRREHEEFVLEEYPLKYDRVLTGKELFKSFGWTVPEGKLYWPKHYYNAVQRRRARRNILPNPHVLCTENMQSISINDICNIDGDILIIGYPFHYKFFKDISDELREEFIPKHIDPAISDKITEMNKSSISVHVRVTDSHETPVAAYYKNAATWMAERVAEPVFYIFSNNIEKAKQCINFPGKVIFTETTTAVQDLYLMSNCHHHIIAESTFSWCGAWLSGKPEQYIIYPEGWQSAVKPPVLVSDTWIPIKGMSYEK